MITNKKYSTLEKVKKKSKNNYNYCSQVMTRTKLGSRINYNNRKAVFRATQVPGAENRPPLRTGNKNILNRKVRNRRFKIKRLLPQFKRVLVK